MIPERKIQICGKDIRMIYCAATENGYEELSGKSVFCFVPTVTKNDKGEDVVEPATATSKDYMMLSIAAIIAASEQAGVEVPITSKEILYEATAQEVSQMLLAIVELRNEWYKVPDVAKEDEKPAEDDGDKPKN